MAKLPSYFEAFLKNINPSRTYLEDQQSGQKALRKRLAEDEEFGDYQVGTFLQGSYARDTAIHPGKDVDVVVVTNLDLSTSPTDANALVKRFLMRHYSGKWSPQNRSFGISLSYVTLDVVLAITNHLPTDEYRSLAKSLSLSEVQIDWRKHPLLIPDRDLNQWVETHPKEQMEATSRLNKQCNGFFVPLVKVFKWWRKEMYVQPKYPKGYILERIVAENIDPAQDTYADHIMVLFHNIVNSYRDIVRQNRIPFLPDPGNPKHNVAGRVTAEHFKAFWEKVSAALPVIQAAYNEPDTVKSANLWRKAFGEKFPKPPSQVSNASFPNKPIVPNKPAGFA